MSVAAGSALVALSALCGLLGYRSGRGAALLLGAFLLAGLVLSLALPAVAATWGWGVAVPAAGLVLLGAARLREALAGDPRAPVARSWRLASAGAGVVLAPLLALVLALAITATTRPAAPSQSNDDAWSGLRRFGLELGQLSGDLVETLPVIGDRARTLTALHVILQAPADHLAVVAERHGLETALRRPSIQAALADDALLADIAAIGEGDLGAVGRLLDAPSLTAVAADPVIRKLAARLDLETVAAELRELAIRQE